MLLLSLYRTDSTINFGIIMFILNLYLLFNIHIFYKYNKIIYAKFLIIFIIIFIKNVPYYLIIFSNN